MKLRSNAIYKIQYYKTKQFPKNEFPICFFCDGSVSPALIAFCKMQMELGAGNIRALERIIVVVARIYHFYLTQKDKHPDWNDDATSLFLAYFSARLHGTITSTGDETGLFYRPIKYDTARNEIRCFEKFHKWCALYLNVVNDRDYIAALTQSYVSEQKKSKFNLLAHLDSKKTQENNTDLGWAMRPRQEFRNDNLSQSGVNYTAFPHTHIVEFIEQQQNINFKAIMLIQSFTGLRGSEALHILTTDIIPNRSGGYEVLVSHPVNGNTFDPTSKKNIRRKTLFDKFAQQAKSYVGLNDKDREFLENIRPRVGISGKYDLEWKGMYLPNVDYDTEFGYTLDWTSDEAKKQFNKLVPKLKSQKRRNHPYLFVTKKSGMPLTLSNYTSTFRSKSENLIGVALGPHSLRHFCGEYCANALNMSVDQTKDILRHSKVESTHKYYKKSKQKVRAEILKISGVGDGKDTRWENLKQNISTTWK